MKVIANNKKVYHDYSVEKTYEAGIVLRGVEIKSVRSGHVNLTDSYAKIDVKGEVYIVNMHISKYTNRHYVDNNLDERSSRKLLLHKEEIKKIKSALAEKGYSLVPTKIYLSKNRAKIEIALVKGKKNHDKRQSLKEKDQKREMEKVMKNKW
jgi:SsrA-binding protein